jgi:hypothetical protein
MRPAVAERAALEQPSTIPSPILFRVKLILLSKLNGNRPVSRHSSCGSSSEQHALVGIVCSLWTGPAKGIGFLEDTEGILSVVAEPDPREIRTRHSLFRLVFGKGHAGSQTGLTHTREASADPRQ